MRYSVDMGKALHVRLDDDTAAAFAIVRATCGSDSDAVRTAIREAARRRRTRGSIEAEVAALTRDEGDRAEKLAILAELDALAPDEHR
jgi:hypothetical protein